ncbi:ribonuclease E/G [Rhodovulum sp. DZ06]|uniref:ribonuclease E/G n=1 Tax=Rhodovulum sp. DZ06 TaxID=3425126 RepID=UPI003D349F86
MKGRIVLLLEEGHGLPTMAALLDDGKLTDILVDWPEDDPTPRPGAVHRARITRLMPGMGAAFLDLGDGTEGFMKGAAAKGWKAGDTLLAQVSRVAEPGKAVPCNDEPLFKGRYAILTPHAPGINVARKIRDEDERARLKAATEAALEELGLLAAEQAESADAPGVIIRTGAEGAPLEAIEDDVRQLAELHAAALAAPKDEIGEVVAAASAEVQAWRDWTDPYPEHVESGGPDLFEHFGVWDAIEALRSPRVDLGEGGAWMSVEPTSALVAVDVNTGGATSPAAGLRANLAAAAALPTQLRLRGLGGQIVLDVAPMGKRDRPKFESALKKALRADPIETTFVGWTPLGNAELLRKRERRPLRALLRGPLPG